MRSYFFQIRILKNDKSINTHDLYLELSKAIGVSVKDVAVMDARLGGPDISLNLPVSSDEEASVER